MVRKLPPWSKRAKMAMIEQDVSVNTLAEDLELSRPYVSSVLNGRVFSLPTMQRISEYLKIQIDEPEVAV